MNSTQSPITLQTAVLNTVEEFANNNQKFSVHDITRNIREKVKKDEFNIPEVQVNGSAYSFDIPHSKIRSLFEDLRQLDAFDHNISLNRYHNGTYWEYTPSVTSPIQVAPPAANTPPSAGTFAAATTPSITSSKKVMWQKEPQYAVSIRVSNYINNCNARLFKPTIKQIQSAIKRSHSSGWSRSELLQSGQ